jgi:transcriptional regulator with XRE-family HTH domain
MARRPAADKKPHEISLTLQKAFDMIAMPSSDANRMAGTMDQPDLQVGLRLRELRQKKNLSIRALAALGGLAVNTLSMIENGKTSPSVSTLQILARTLDVPIAAFFEQETVEKKVVYVSHPQRPVVTMDTTRLEHLGKDLAGSAVQPFVVTLEPGSGSGQSLIVHTGHEFVYCLSGQILYLIENETYLLTAGDSIVFESHLPHRWQNPGAEPAQVILVLIPAGLRESPADRHFLLE